MISDRVRVGVRTEAALNQTDNRNSSIFSLNPCRILSFSFNRFTVKATQSTAQCICFNFNCSYDYNFDPATADANVINSGLNASPDL